MSLNTNQNKGISPGEGGNIKSQKQQKRVLDVILSPTHPGYRNPDDIGVIFYGDVNLREDAVDPLTLPRAKPLNRTVFSPPSIGDIVLITEAASADHYSDLDGVHTNVTSYYSPSLNVYNSAIGIDSLPLEKKTGPRNTGVSKTEPQVGSFEFQKEFRGPDREVLNTQVNKYLRDLGYISGRNDAKAPRYALFQDESTKNYIYRLEDSEDTKFKANKYFKAPLNAISLLPGEGDSIIESKAGVRHHATTVGPPGTNIFSKDATEIEGDGNPDIGNKALAISLGNGSQENLVEDAASLYMGDKVSIPIDPTSEMTDSLEGEFEYANEDVIDKLVTIAALPPSNIDLNNAPGLITDSSIEWDFDNSSSLSNIEATNQNVFIASNDPDPVFAALDNAQNEGLLEFETDDEGIEAGSTADISEIGSSSFGIDSYTDNYNIPDDSYNPNPDESSGGDPGGSGGGSGNDEGGIIGTTYGYNANEIDWVKDYSASGIKFDGGKTGAQSNIWALSKEDRRKQYKTICANAKVNWDKGLYNDAVWANKYGDIFILPPPDPELYTILPETAREGGVAYLMIHFTAGSNVSTNNGVKTNKPITKTMLSFLTTKEDSKKIKRGWDKGGYHWMIDWEGRPTRCYPDSSTTNGTTGPRKKDGIHINFLGGAPKDIQPADAKNKTTIEKERLKFGYKSSNLEGEKYCPYPPSKAQILALKKIILKYIEIYPDIKVVGHYQDTNKPCPAFDVPYFMRGLGLGHNTVDGNVSGKSDYGFTPENNSDRFRSEIDENDHRFGLKKGDTHYLTENAQFLLQFLGYGLPPLT